MRKALSISGASGLLACIALAGCGPRTPPPPATFYHGLPVSGSLADAHRGGFTACLDDNSGGLRCRRDGVMIDGHGPYSAALDLRYSDGGGGFDQLTLWHDRDQYAVYAVVDALMKQGWRECYTGVDDRGDQAIYTHPGAAVFVSMDLSYWGKRRLRVLPVWNHREKRC